jgi:ferredoxin
MLVIDPDECIDCAQCVVECPVNAIYEENDVPQEQKHFILINAEQAKLWPPIVEKRAPDVDADKWAKVLDKQQYLSK